MNPDPDTDPHLVRKIRIQGFDDQKLKKKNTAEYGSGSTRWLVVTDFHGFYEQDPDQHQWDADPQQRSQGLDSKADKY